MPFLRYIQDDEYQFFELPTDRMTIFGREEHVDFQIMTDAGISREHFAIEKDETTGKMLLIDLGSNNGTFLNGKKLSNDTVPISEGDVIKAGNQVFYYFTHKPLEVYKPKIVHAVPPPPPQDNTPKSFAEQMKDLVKSYNPNKNKTPGSHKDN